MELSFTIRPGAPQIEEWYKNLVQKAKNGTLSTDEEELLELYLKTIRFLSQDPRHPSLHTHEIESLTTIFTKMIGATSPVKVFEAYMENQTPGARRLFWTYGPGRREITVLAIEHHPENRKAAYESIKLSVFPMPKNLSEQSGKVIKSSTQNRHGKKRK